MAEEYNRGFAAQAMAVGGDDEYATKGRVHDGPHLYKEFVCLQEEVSGVHDQLAKLEERLSGILSPEAPSPSRDERSDRSSEPCSDLVGQARSMANSLRIAREKAHRILSRLEL